MADNIVLAKYKADVKDALKSIDQLDKKVGKLDKDTKKSSKDMQSSFISAFSKIGAAAGIAFGTQQLVSFGKEAVKVAAQFEGVERAFKRIGGANSANLLKGLRDATRGTVSDLQLMQKAVQASNFKIPLESLASLFKFAQARARETGESVEYLTNSIVLGIGRKSPLILDNLGISAVELRARLKGVGVEAANVGDIAEIIGDIAEEELAKMGDQADTTADKIAQLNVAMENLQVQGGQAIIEAGSELADSWSGATEQLKELIDTEDDLNIFGRVLKHILDDLTAPFKALGFIAEGTLKIFNGVKNGIVEIYNNARADLAGAGILYQIQEQSEEAERSIGNVAGAIASAYALINKEQSEVIKNLAYYNELIKDLQDKQKDANTTRAEVRQLEDEINEAIRQRLILLGRLRDVGGESMQQIESIANMELLAQQQLTDDILADYAHRNGEIEAAIEKRNETERRLAEERAQEQAFIQQAITQETLSTISNMVGSISQIQQNAFTQEQQVLEQQLEQGLITRDEFEKKQVELQRKSAQASKDAALFQAIIGTAQAVINALASPGVPFPVAAAFAALAGVQGAVQIAAIASQPLPQFAEGGWVDADGKLVGRSHAQGGIKLEAEGGEYIVNKIQSKKHAELIESINSGRVEDYIASKYIIPTVQQIDGQMSGMAASAALNGFNDMNLLRAFDRNRQSEKANAKFIVSGVVNGLKQSRSRWN